MSTDTIRSDRPRRTARVGSASVLVAALVLLLAACGGGGGEHAKVEVVGEESSATHEYVIPFGTYNRLQGGERIEIVPRVLEVDVGDVIRIRNEDAYGSQVGIFHVGAGETVTMKFKTPGELKGACDVHPSGEFIIDVQDRPEV
jgi:plastocyanin